MQVKMKSNTSFREVLKMKNLFMTLICLFITGTVLASPSYLPVQEEDCNTSPTPTCIPWSATHPMPVAVNGITSTPTSTGTLTPTNTPSPITVIAIPSGTQTPTNTANPTQVAMMIATEQALLTQMQGTLNYEATAVATITYNGGLFASPTPGARVNDFIQNWLYSVGTPQPVIQFGTQTPTATPLTNPLTTSYAASPTPGINVNDYIVNPNPTPLGGYASVAEQQTQVAVALTAGTGGGSSFPYGAGTAVPVIPFGTQTPTATPNTNWALQSYQQTAVALALTQVVIVPTPNATIQANAAYQLTQVAAQNTANAIATTNYPLLNNTPTPSPTPQALAQSTPVAFTSGYNQLIAASAGTTIYVGGMLNYTNPSLANITFSYTALTTATTLQFEYGSGNTVGPQFVLPVGSTLATFTPDTFLKVGAVNTSFGVYLSGAITGSFNIPYNQH
jgi:hypothetical protein